MKYLLTIGYDDGVSGTPAERWKPEDIRAQLDHYDALTNELMATGEYVDGHTLTGPSLAKVVTSDGATANVTPGPRAEPVTMLAGFHLIDVESEARAVEIAGRLSQAPGPGGVPLQQPIGVRRVMSITDVEPL